MYPDQLFEHKQYSLPVVEKEKFLFDRLLQLHKFHLDKSEGYKKISLAIFNKKASSVADLMFLPVSIFKNHEIKSIDNKEIFKVITSSGTTGTIPSRIYLDRQTASLQTKALIDIMQYVLGNERLPMMIVDTIDVIKNRSTFSARGAGILGMSVFGKSHFYLLDANMNINYSGLKEFLSKYNGKPMLLFGFTYLVWQFLYESGINADLSNAILFHSGGWKKMLEKEVDNATFKKKLKEKLGINRVYNFYGMIEQVGSVFVECDYGFLHTPNFADVIIRNPYDFTECKNGEDGVIQVLSALPESYPGHSLLTEDLGRIVGEDNCKCGRKGKYFLVLGRMKKAELRGCSDTFINANAN